MSDPLQPQFGDDGLITAVVQDDGTSEVLMVAHMNRDGVGCDASHASRNVFQPIAAATLGEGRDQREHDACANDSH